MSRRRIEPARVASATLTVLPLKIPNNQTSGISIIRFRVRDENNRVVDKIEKELLVEVKHFYCKLQVLKSNITVRVRFAEI